MGTLLIIQWLGLSTSIVGGMGSFPDQGIKILHATLHGQNPKQQQKQSKTTQNKNYTHSMFNFNWTNILFSNVIYTVLKWGEIL